VSGSGGDHGAGVGEPLPRARDAVIPPEKLARYALAPTSVGGRDKAFVFERVLGIGQYDWEYLRDQIQDALPHHPVSAVRQPKRPEQETTWKVLVPVTGLNGNVALVVTAWRLVDGRPRLASTRVADRQSERPAGGTL
jgi:S-formylglutathione hydrolase FrmB